MELQRLLNIYRITVLIVILFTARAGSLCCRDPTLNDWDGSLDCATAAGERMNSYFSPLFELCQFISELEFKDGGTFWCGLSLQETTFKYLTCAAKVFDDRFVVAGSGLIGCSSACSWFISGKKGLDHPGDITLHICGRHECVWYNWIYLGEASCD